ncbi:MAG TPA: hypothetical protein VFQ35_22200, partial [Polyangiaceae bacterium]|nr:hypothetical protein [Polyangiaceae bacterium]
DGLSQLDETLFLDSDLLDVGVTALEGEANYLRYQSPAARRLCGIHALYGLTEPSLVSVPDAALRRWHKDSDAVASIPPPDAQSPAAPRPMRACDDGRDFLDCDFAPPTRPLLNAPQNSDAHGDYTLSWAPGSQFILEEALRPDYADATTIYAGPRQSIEFRGHTPGNFYYRVRSVRDGLSSAWSEGRLVHVQPPLLYRTEARTDYRPDILLAVQRALLRLCAVRGDMMAVLCAPEGVTELDAIAHAGVLRSFATTTSTLVPPLGQGEASALSFGALYHPWLIGRDTDRSLELRTSPPDGAATGVIARRTIARGAWLAPANELLEGVVALARPAASERMQSLYDAQINVFSKKPRGFLAEGADTLSLDEDLVPIGVRRLMSLLRRAALEAGQVHVFEPNDPAFRRLIERNFEALLTNLYTRGAFAGKTTASAFQVVADATINSAASVDQGRFFVELRVAPSLPLTFLTVRLLQDGAQSRVTEGA